MLNVSITPHREFLPADTPEQRLFIMLKLQPSLEACLTPPSTSFVFIIDTSASMYEVVGGDFTSTGVTLTKDGKTYNQVIGGVTKLDIVIQSLRELIHSQRLTAQDYIALIQFDDQASTLIDLTPATEINKIEAGINQLKDFSGGTCMGSGMNQALSLLAHQKMTTRRALIFTDGQTFDVDECSNLAQQFSHSNIPITALGIGDYEESLLMGLSDTTGGHLHHIVPDNATGTQTSINDLPNLLFQDYQQAQNEVINNLKLNVRTVEGVQLARITRVYPDQAEFCLSQPPYALGNAIAKDETIFILEFSINPRSVSRIRIAQLGLTYDIPGLKRRGELPPQNVVVQFVTGQGGTAQVDQEVMHYVQQRNISQLVGDATKLVDQNPQQAEKLLETARRMTVKIGNDAILQSLNQASEELRKTRKISPGTRKTVKMGSRSKTVKMSNNINDELSPEMIRKLSGT